MRLFWKRNKRRQRELGFDSWIIFENYCLLKLSSLAGGWLLKVTMNNGGI